MRDVVGEVGGETTAGKRNWFLYAVLAVIAAWSVLLLTPHGIGVTPDGVVYVTSAEHFLRGDGFVALGAQGELEPVTHYPLLYPLALAAISTVVGSAQEAARWVSAVSLAGIVALSAYITGQLSKQPRFALLGGLLVAVSPGMFLNFLFALSEPLFLLLLLAGAYLLFRSFPGPNRSKLFAASILIGLSAATRYAGLAFVASAILYSLFQHYPSVRRRMITTFVVASASTLPVALLLLRNLSVADSAINRTLQFHPLMASALLSGLHTVGTWLLPGIAPPLSLYFAAINGLSFAGLLSFLRPLNQETGRFLKLAGLFSAGYTGFLVVSLSLVDAYTPLDARILAPLQLFWIVGFVMLLAEAASRVGSVEFVRLLPAALPGIVVFISLYLSASAGAESYQYGLGYNHQSSRESATLKIAEELPEDTILYSNAPDLLYFHTGRTARWLPRKYDPVSRAQNSDYSSELRLVANEVQKQCAALVYFHFAGMQRHYLPNQSELDRELAELRRVSSSDGLIYGSQSCDFMTQLR